MYGEIYKIKEIRDDNQGESIVNSYLEKGWQFISACSVNSSIVYAIGADKETYENTKQTSKLNKFLES